jgi:hypothetical protein
MLPERLGDEPYGAAVARGNRELLDIVDRAIARFKDDGGWSASHLRYLGATNEAPPRHGRRATLADLSGAGPPHEPQHSRQPSVAILRTIRRRGYVTVGVRPGAPGLCEETASGTFAGFEIDIARRIAAELFGDESRVRFVPLRTRQRIDSVRSFMRVLEPVLRAYSILFTLLSSNWWYLGMKGCLPEFLCPPECIGALDFVGLDYYWGIGTLRLGSIGKLFDAANQRYSLAPVQPNLLYDIVKAHAASFPGKEVIIVENGCVAEADGVTKDRYLRAHVDQVRRAVADGIGVSMYLCWTITSNREWGLPLDKDSDFGLFRIELDRDPALRRIATTSSAAYRDIIARRGVAAGA